MALLDGVPASTELRDRDEEARMYDWVIIPVNCQRLKMYARWLLIRRNTTDPTDVTFFACCGPPRTTLADLVRILGMRWAIDECFELAKGDCGLEEYEVRSWIGWYRHTTLSLFALEAATVIHSRISQTSTRKKGGIA